MISSNPAAPSVIPYEYYTTGGSACIVLFDYLSLGTVGILPIKAGTLGFGFLRL